MALDLDQHGALVDRFSATKPDYLLHAEHSTAQTIKLRTHEEAGMKSDSIAGVIKTAAAAANSAQESIHDRAERQSKQRFDDMILLALYENGELDNFIGETVFGGMSDGEVSDVVEMVEAETGKNFEDYARDVLGDEMPDRRPGESDADYHKRLLIELTPKVLDNGKIRPGYENDPLAKFLQDQEITKEARAVVAQHNENAKALGMDAVSDAATADAEASLDVAKAMNAEADVEGLSLIGVESHDTHSESALNNASASDASSSFLAGFPGSDGALETASTDFSAQFGAASPDTVEVAKVESSLDLTLKS